MIETVLYKKLRELNIEPELLRAALHVHILNQVLLGLLLLTPHHCEEPRWTPKLDLTSRPLIERDVPEVEASKV